MSCSSLSGADKIGHFRPFEFKVCSFYCFEALASFHHGSLSHWAFAATPTRGEILVQLGTLSRKPRSAKRKNSSSTEKDRLVLAKVQKLGVSSSSPSTHVRKPERAPSFPYEASTTLSSQPRSRSTTKAENPLGEAVGQPLTIRAHYYQESADEEC